MSRDLNPDKALIFRIVHRDNLSTLLRNGLECKSIAADGGDYTAIGNAELISKRATRNVPVPPGGTLSDYVPFYFTPYSPMLYNIHTGWAGIQKRRNEEIIFVVTSLHRLLGRNVTFLFTDRHANLQTARFYADLGDLSCIDWPLLQSRDFKRDPENPDKLERYQAEALVHMRLPADALLGIVCYDDSSYAGIDRAIRDQGLELKVVKRPEWYF